MQGDSQAPLRHNAHVPLHLRPVLQLAQHGPHHTILGPWPVLEEDNQSRDSQASQNEQCPVVVYRSVSRAHILDERDILSLEVRCIEL